MVLERFFPADFAGGLSNGTAGSLQGTRWPIAYEELRPWYDAAERLYRVRGEADPLRPTEAGALLPASDFSREGAVVFSTLVQQGMHPYRVHVACEARDGCGTCQGYLCAAECKNDAARMCVSPAVREYGASLLTECVALTLEAGPASVKHLVCSWRGQRLVLRAKTYVLAAGALLTPAVLLNSKSASWPNGLANHSGLVGRNLMRHAIDLYVLTRAPRLPPGAPTKELAFNDFCGSEKLGTVQSFGVAMPLGYLRNRPGLNLWRLLGPAAPWLWRHHDRRPILGAILEDSPSIENRVEPRGEPDAARRYRLALRYRLHADDLARRRRFRLVLAKVLAPFKPVRVRGTTDRPALGHVCGTCRFGVDPQTSVLDSCNRAHGLSNLYVVDGSFFPSSGGMNPALTIAANALRVAYHLNRR
jgi:choline dehydrogenase-like flavoprotein